ncbi:MAG TPA: cation-transporting P-type ATPase [Gaiellaceae bacterium]|nr:cation-transporting P-type ATPase [Gaiellaceae bacterium]
MTATGSHVLSEGPPEGLTEAEAAERLVRDGPNALPAPRERPAWVALVRQMTHFFALLLWAAAVLAFAARLVPLAVAIVVVVIVNGVFAFLQEHRAERAARRLGDLVPRRATVVREGVRRGIPAEELVVDDLVLLEAGDRVAADLHVVESHDLLLDESMLTGESAAVAPSAGDPAFSATFVVEGEGLARVAATGARTRLASIAELTRGIHRPPTPLALELTRVVRTISLVALSVGVVLYFVALLLGLGASDALIFGIGVTVALVPEGLLPTVTLSLAIGAQRMAAKNALVRRLESVETLGSTTFVCTDKTGTLTRNEMEVVEAWTPDGRVTIRGTGYEPDAAVEPDSPAALAAVREAALAAVRCSTGQAVLRDGRWQAEGDPMEAALDVLARRLGVDAAADRRAVPDRRRFPFDPRRRRMSVVAGERVAVKGAPDTVLPRCRNRARAESEVNDLAERGLRVIAVAGRSCADGVPATAEEAEQGLELLALLALEDPPRPAAAGAIAACRRAGIKVAMVTGDHPATAEAIAREVGLLGAEEVVVTGEALPADEDALGELLDRDGLVLARVSPEEKHRIAVALHRRGHVVAMTGDGVNDGPALQQADIGIAMGRTGTDVAREASDLVLLDDDFATLVTAIEQGRATFANIRRFLTYHLTDNVAELTPFAVWALSGGNIPLALSVLAVLALDIGTDTFSAVALGAEPPETTALGEPPARGRLLDRVVAVRAFGVLGPTEALLEMGAFFAVFLAAGWRPGDSFADTGVALAASGAAFLAVVIGQTANAFACRSATVGPGRLGWTTNRFLLAAVAVEGCIAAACLFVPGLASRLDQELPTAAGVVVALLAAPAVLAADALYKAVVARRQPPVAAA